MELESISLSAYNRRYRHIELVVLPFEIPDVPAVFMDLMDKVFSNEPDQFVSARLDNILTYSDAFENHLKRLKTVLERLTAETLYGKLSKCNIAFDQVKYHVLQ